MDEEVERGSDRLWKRLAGSGSPKGDELAEALALAGDDYRILRWWKYGQPGIDLIRGVLEVTPDRLGEVATSLVKLHGEEMNVRFEVFPYGIINPDVLRVHVELEGNVHG